MSTHLSNRTERLAALERLLVQRRDGVRVVDLAATFGVDRRTIYRDLSKLRDNGVPIYQRRGRFFISLDYYDATVQLNIHETVALFLAVRGAFQVTDQQNPHLISALAKLGLPLSEPLALHMKRVVGYLSRSPIDRHFVNCVELLTQAWEENRWIRLWYSGRKDSIEFAPYFLEKSTQVGIVVIGYDAEASTIRSVPLNQVIRVKLLVRTYTVPAAFSPEPYLAGAIGVVGDDTPRQTRVVLRFSAQITRLINTRRWHAAQHIKIDEQGRCLLSLQVPSWQDLLPWVRAWGADVEVLEPEAMRSLLADEVTRLVNMYNDRSRSHQDARDPSMS